MHRLHVLLDFVWPGHSWFINKHGYCIINMSKFLASHCFNCYVSYYKGINHYILRVAIEVLTNYIIFLN